MSTLERPVSDTDKSVSDTDATLVSDTDRAVLELVDVVKTYRGSPPVHALAGVSLHVTDGELVAVVGPSGSGKSTLLNVIGTLDRPTSGSMLVEGRDVTSMSDASLAGLRVGEPDSGGWFNAQVNETWNRAPLASIVARFQQGLG